VHEYPYIQHLINKCEHLTAGPASHNPNLPSFYAKSGSLDCDTPLSQDSLDAARGFCGAAIAAIDVVLNKSDQTNRAFSAVLEPVQVQVLGVCLSVCLSICLSVCLSVEVLFAYPNTSPVHQNGTHREHS
jgi:hypothetical protein